MKDSKLQRVVKRLVKHFVARPVAHPDKHSFFTKMREIDPPTYPLLPGTICLMVNLLSGQQYMLYKPLPGHKDRYRASRVYPSGIAKSFTIPEKLAKKLFRTPSIAISSYACTTSA